MIHDEVRNVIKAAGAVTGPSGVGMITEHGAPTPLILKLEDRFPAIERGERADRRRCIFATRWQAAVTGPQAKGPVPSQCSIQAGRLVEYFFVPRIDSFVPGFAQGQRARQLNKRYSRLWSPTSNPGFLCRAPR
jgi:hypothetical protein